MPSGEDVPVGDGMIDLVPPTRAAPAVEPRVAATGAPACSTRPDGRDDAGTPVSYPASAVLDDAAVAQTLTDGTRDLQLLDIQPREVTVVRLRITGTYPGPAPSDQVAISTLHLGSGDDGQVPLLPTRP
ncbi:hypothetical protein ACFFKU_11050 [Kineococcus gynurae]|uniref:hypothetical protein n=1 Tax=Kineococcus gynurae TaxID=452979 RepID=UPI0035EC35D6